MGNDQSAPRPQRSKWPWEEHFGRYEEWMRALPHCDTRGGEQLCMESKGAKWMKFEKPEKKESDKWQKVRVPVVEWPRSQGHDSAPSVGPPDRSGPPTYGKLELQGSHGGRHSHPEAAHAHRNWRQSMLSSPSGHPATRSASDLRQSLPHSRNSHLGGSFASSSSDIFYVTEQHMSESASHLDIRRSYDDRTRSPGSESAHDVSLYCTMPNSSRNSMSNRDLLNSLYGSGSGSRDRRSSAGNRKPQLDLSPAERRRCLGDITNSGFVTTRTTSGEAQRWVYHKVLLSDINQASWSATKSSMLRDAVAAAVGVGSSDVEIMAAKDRCGKRLLSLQLQVEFRVKTSSREQAEAIFHQLQTEDLEDMLVQAGFTVKKEGGAAGAAAEGEKGGGAARLSPPGYRNGYSLEKNLHLYCSQPSARGSAPPNPYGSTDDKMGMLM